jgi:hypothetical protein
MFSCLYLFFAAFSASTIASAQVPEVLFHFGKREILEIDIQAQAIPREAWDRFIMGNETRYDLPRYRRGLYGATEPGYADFFGDQLLESGNLPWMMEIQLSDHCRQEQSLIDPRTLPFDGRFWDWFDQSRPLEFQNVVRFVDACYSRESNGSYRPLYKTIRMNGVEGPCELTVAQFLEQTHVQVVIDHAWGESFYLRDRSCIEAIRGTALEQIHWMISKSTYFRQVPIPYQGRRITSPYPRYGSGTFVILMQALLELEAPLSNGDMHALRLQIQSSELSEDYLSVPAGTDPDWFKNYALKALDLYEHDLILFQARAHAFIAGIRTLRSPMPEPFMALVRSALGS